jgi:uncharacterized membrane protein YphA (DoxX/SURF4 family)
MLTPLPALLDYAILAPTLLRLAAAFVFVYLGAHHFRSRSEVASEMSILTPAIAAVAASFYVIFELLIAVGLFFGAYTQIAALVGAAIAIKTALIRRSLRHVAPLARSTYILLGVICLTLLFTGAGALAFDLPL